MASPKLTGIKLITPEATPTEGEPIYFGARHWHLRSASRTVRFLIRKYFRFRSKKPRNRQKNLHQDRCNFRGLTQRTPTTCPGVITRPDASQMAPSAQDVISVPHKQAHMNRITKYYNVENTNTGTPRLLVWANSKAEAARLLGVKPNKVATYELNSTNIPVLNPEKNPYK